MKRSATAIKDAVITAIAAVCVFVVAESFDIFETFTEWSREHEEWAVDELMVVAAFLAVAFGILAWRRTRALRREFAQRKRVADAQFKLASIVKNSIDAIDSKTLDGTIVSLNSSGEKLYGYSEEEIKGKHISILTPPAQREEMMQILERIKQGEPPVSSV